MELLFLGSGAGELWPSPFCDCEACRQAVQARGAQRRVGSCLLVDQTYLFDLPPCCNLAACELGVSLASVRHLFVTHSHQDHFDPCILAARGRGPDMPLHMYCNQYLADLLPAYQEFNRFFVPERLGLHVHVMAPGDVDRAVDGAFMLTALQADHDTTGGEEPLIFIFEASGRSLLYACDTGLIPEESWQRIAQHQYDAVILDCTFHLDRECRRGHLGLAAFLEQKQRFEAAELLHPSAAFVAQHIFHGHGEGCRNEEDISAEFTANGIVLARDGMRLEI